jgi:hypothetical protein
MSVLNQMVDYQHHGFLPKCKVCLCLCLCAYELYAFSFITVWIEMHDVFESVGSASSILAGEHIIMMKDGVDVTENFKRGVDIAMEKAKLQGAELALLKSKSPSCGLGIVYDGSFTGKLVDGDGLLGHACRLGGIQCISSDSIREPIVDVEDLFVLARGSTGGHVL